MLLGIIVGVIVFIVIIIPIIIPIIVVCVTCGVWGGIAASRRSNRRHGGGVVTVAPVVQTVPASAGQPAAVVYSYQMQPTKTVVPVASSMEHGPSLSGQQGQVHVEVNTPATYPQDPKLTEEHPPAYPGTKVTSQQ